MLIVIGIGTIVIGLAMIVAQKQSPRRKSTIDLVTYLAAVVLWGWVMALGVQANNWLLVVIAIVVVLMSLWHSAASVIKLVTMKKS